MIKGKLGMIKGKDKRCGRDMLPAKLSSNDLKSNLRKAKSSPSIDIR